MIHAFDIAPFFAVGFLHALQVFFLRHIPLGHGKEMGFFFSHPPLDPPTFTRCGFAVIHPSHKRILCKYHFFCKAITPSLEQKSLFFPQKTSIVPAYFSMGLLLPLFWRAGFVCIFRPHLWASRCIAVINEKTLYRPLFFVKSNALPCDGSYQSPFMAPQTNP